MSNDHSDIHRKVFDGIPEHVETVVTVASTVVTGAQVVKEIMKDRKKEDGKEK